MEVSKAASVSKPSVSGLCLNLGLGKCRLGLEHNGHKELSKKENNLSSHTHVTMLMHSKQIMQTQ